MSISYIGTSLSIVAGTPATEDVSDYAALSWTEIGKCVSVGELGDTSEDIAFNLLKGGRTIHVNGTKDVGEVPVTIEYDDTDAGQVIVRAANNTNTTHSFKVTDQDGKSRYFQGLIASLRDLERTPNTYKGQTFAIRGQTAIVDD